MSFGSGTEKQREITASVHDSTLAANTTSDLFKQINLGQRARVISVVDKIYFKVQLLDDDIIVNATLGKAVNEFQSAGVPDVGHTVWVTHKKDFTFCKVEHKITDEIDLELTKRTEGSEAINFRWDNMPLNNEDKVAKAYKDSKARVDELFKLFNMIPAVT